jgi:integrase
MVTSRAGNKDQYLHQPAGRAGTWYVRVRVPRTLEQYTGQTHIRRSLHTTSKAEANLRKHAVVGQIKRELEELRRKPPAAGEPGLTFADAKSIRAELEKLRATGDHEQLSTVELVTAEHAERIEQLYGHDKANRWYRAATTTTESLSELMDRWLGSSDYKESTKLGHRKALAEVLSFIGDEDAHPEDVTQAKALAYIDTDLSTRGLAASTMRDRLVSLGGFWAWMATRGAVPRGPTPWTGHRISKKQHRGTRPPKRKGGFTDKELLALLGGTDRVKAWPTYSYLPDLMVLGMFTGARIESLCALSPAVVEKLGDGYVLRIENDKTDAGARPVGVSHPAAVVVLARRLKGRKGAALLFPELTPGGADKKQSSSATKAFVRYRRACGVADGADFHSFRRNVTTILEGAGATQAEIARFVGHKLGTLAGDTYSGPRAASWALEMSRSIRYDKAAEAEALKLAGA